MRINLPHRRSASLRAASLIALTLLSGCGDGLSGSKYQEADSKDGIEFKSGHKADVTIMGTTTETTYSTDGNKIMLDGPGGQKLVLTRESDGTISGFPLSGPLKKV